MHGFIEKNKVPFNSEGVNSACGFVSRKLSENNSSDSEVAQEIDDNKAKLKDNRLEGKFVSKNVINLLQR